MKVTCSSPLLRRPVPSRSARWTLSGPMCPALERLGGRLAAFVRGYGVSARETSLPSLVIAASGTQICTPMRALQERTSTFVQVRKVHALQNRSDRQSKPLWLLISISLSHSACRPLSRRHLHLTTTTSTVNTKNSFLLGTPWTITSSALATRPPTCRNASPCRSRDADIRTSAASEDAPAQRPRNRWRVTLFRHKLTANIMCRTFWRVARCMMHRPLTTMFPGERL